jgi:hypothetical protein
MFSPRLNCARSASPHYNPQLCNQCIAEWSCVPRGYASALPPDAGGRNSSRRRHGVAKALAYDTGVSLRNSYLRSL